MSVAHNSEDCKLLEIHENTITQIDDLENLLSTKFNDVCVLVFPPENKINPTVISSLITPVIDNLSNNATLIVIGETPTLVEVHKNTNKLNYHLWVVIKRKTIKYNSRNNSLPNHHFGALVYTKYKGSLKHTATRIKYTYCPACQKTTKDYGGKKHTYNPYGTLISDIWRDISCDLEGDLSLVIRRFADLFGLNMYNQLRILDFRQYFNTIEPIIVNNDRSPITKSESYKTISSNLLLGDCISNLKTIPENSVDFAFIDPPYNLGKKYNNYADDLSIKEYFLWCDEWITEIIRTLKPHRTLAILNIPIWTIRHFLFMREHLEFQNWIAWDALSFPVRKIMPAHYSIICFSKGESRSLPGLSGSHEVFDVLNSPIVFQPLEPLEESYCLRASCVKKRNKFRYTDRGQLTDLWWDIHRLKHNSRRVDHPCQLPAQLMYRLISIFTKPDEVVLDCFNGAGTTSLSAHQMKRKYIGIELSEKYYNIAKARHDEILMGLDPFRKADRKLTEKNSNVPRLEKKQYEIPKKTLQLEVRRVSKELNRLPSREDIIKFGKYPIRYYDEYFASWGEVCAAARHDGMVETRNQESSRRVNFSNKSQQIDLFDKGLSDAKR